MAVCTRKTNGFAILLVLALALSPGRIPDASAAAGDIDTSFGENGVATIDVGRTNAFANRVFVQNDGRIMVAGGSSRGWQDAMFVLARFEVDGRLDPTFGEGGRVLTRPRSWTQDARGAALQVDGKIVLVGAAREGSSNRFGVARYLADGTLDPTFGEAGVVLVDMAPSAPADIAVQADGRIVVLGDLLELARLSPDGSLDTSFGDGGRASHRLGRFASWRSLALQDDGAIVVAGDVGQDSPVNRRYAVARVDTSGQIDRTFGDDGLTVVDDLGTSWSGATDIAVQTDGRIVTVFEGPSRSTLVALRFTDDGRVDPTFGANGRLLADRRVAPRGVALQADGGIVVTGPFSLVRLSMDGSRDRRFGVDGFLATGAVAQAVAIGPSGEIVIAGYSWSERDEFTATLAVVRHTSDGGRDLSFGDRGLVTMRVRAANDVPRGVAALPDGKIVIAGGTSGGGTGADVAAARLNPDGTLDSGFGVKGKLRIDTTGVDWGDGAVADSVGAIAVQSDGRIVAAGSSHDGQDEFHVVRLAATGDLDLSFGVAGAVGIYNNCDSGLDAVAVRGDGRILGAGSLSSDCGSGIRIVRLLPDGTPDPMFGTNGRVNTDLYAGAHDWASPIALAADGTVVVAGRIGLAPAMGGLARYGEDGSLDPQFGAGGYIAIDSPSFTVGISALAVLNGGSVIAAAGQGSQDLVVTRLDPTGALDASFGDGGVATTDFSGGDDWTTALAVQSDGKIVVAGLSLLGPSVRAVIARFLPDGDLDASFGSGGKVILPLVPLWWTGVYLSIGADGGIFVSAPVLRGPSADFAVVRLEGDSASTCGNSAVEPAESCDDGNAAGGDGCSPSCAVERCFRCTGELSLCVPTPPEDPACEPPASCPASDDPDFSDVDADGRADVCDRCPEVASVDDDDTDQDGVGNACDLCPLDWDPANADEDGDRVGEACDRCAGGHLLEEPRRLRITGDRTAPGDDHLVLRAAFAAPPGTTLDSIVTWMEVEVTDVSSGVDFHAVLAGSFSAQTGGWKRNAAGHAWPWRYRSAQGAFPRVRARLRADAEVPGRVHLHVTARRGGFASLPIALPLRASVKYYDGNSASCAKVVYDEGGSPQCERRPGGSLLCH